MWIIMWSVTALWLDHGRHITSRAPLPPIVVSSPLSLTVEQSPDLPTAIVEHTLEEAAAIWCPLGVTFTWHYVLPGEPSHATNELRVIFTDASADGDADLPLGWIRFLTPGTAEPIVHLSRAAARRLLASAPSLRDKPADWQNTLLARILGRAFAHELGHYVLASKSHATHGLMRPSLPLDVLISTERVGFELAS